MRAKGEKLRENRKLKQCYCKGFYKLDHRFIITQTMHVVEPNHRQRWDQNSWRKGVGPASLHQKKRERREGWGEVRFGGWIFKFESKGVGTTPSCPKGKP